MGAPQMCRYPPSTIHIYLDLPSTQIIQTHTHTYITPHYRSRPWSKPPTHSPHTPLTPPHQTQTYAQHPPCPHRIGKAQTQFSQPLSPLSTHTAPSQTHTHVTHSTNTSHFHQTINKHCQTRNTQNKQTH